MEKVSATIEVGTIQLNNEEYSNTSNISNTVNSNIANVLGLDVSNENTYSMVLTEQSSDMNMVLISDDNIVNTANKYSNTDTISVDKLNNNVQVIDITNGVYDIDITYNNSYEMVTIRNTKTYTSSNEKSITVRELKSNSKIKVTNIEKDGFILLDSSEDEWIKKDDISTKEEANKKKQGNALISIYNPDVNYNGGSVKLSAYERDLLERLVMGEAGAEGFEGAALVAQTIRDYIVYRDFKSVSQVRISCGYSGSISKKPNEDVKRAVSYIFDQGGYAVRHEIYYFYAYKSISSSWHESQQFIVKYGGHKFFSRW